MKELHFEEQRHVSGGFPPALIIIVAGGAGATAGKKAAQFVKSLF